MGRGSINRILTFVIILLVIFFVGRLFVALLPVLVVGGFILWLVFKIKSKSKNKEYENKTTYKKDTYSASSFKEEVQGDVIDVDYEDV